MSNGIPDPFEWYCDSCFDRDELTYNARTDGWYCVGCLPLNKREPDTLLEAFENVVRLYGVSESYKHGDYVIAKALSYAAYEKALRLSPFSHDSVVSAWTQR